MTKRRLKRNGPTKPKHQRPGIGRDQLFLLENAPKVAEAKMATPTGFAPDSSAPVSDYIGGGYQGL